MVRIISITLLLMLVGCGGTKKATNTNTTVSSSTIHNIGANNTVSFPSSWQFKEFPMPKIGDLNPVNFRVYAENTRIAITGFASKTDFAESVTKIKTGIEAGVKTYIDKSVEGTANLVEFGNNSTAGVYSSFTCKSTQPCFMPMRGMLVKYVTVASIVSNGMIYTLTVATNEAENQAIAINSIKSVMGR